MRKFKKVYLKDGKPQVKELIVLAPFEYYKKYYANSPKSIENLYTLKDIYKEDKISVIFKSINLSLKEWDDLISIISIKCKIEPQSKKEKNGKTHKIINFKNKENEKLIKNYVNNELKDKFEICKWQILNEAKDWNFK